MALEFHWLHAERTPTHLFELGKLVLYPGRAAEPPYLGGIQFVDWLLVQGKDALDASTTIGGWRNEFAGLRSYTDLL